MRKKFCQPFPLGLSLVAWPTYQNKSKLSTTYNSSANTHSLTHKKIYIKIDGKKGNFLFFIFFIFVHDDNDI